MIPMACVACMYRAPCCVACFVVATLSIQVAKTVNPHISEFAQVMLESCAYAGTGDVLKVQQLLALCGQHITQEEDPKPWQVGPHTYQKMAHTANVSKTFTWPCSTPRISYQPASAAPLTLPSPWTLPFPVHPTPPCTCVTPSQHTTHAPPDGAPRRCRAGPGTGGHGRGSWSADVKPHPGAPAAVWRPGSAVRAGGG